MTWPQAAQPRRRTSTIPTIRCSASGASRGSRTSFRTSPADLLNGNIFHPEKRTLAYTDSVLLEGLAGAPLIWSGVSRVTTYNLLLLLSIALSGWAMWRYAFYLTGHSAAAILAGIIFAFVPYRFDHFHHLELQATIFLPLTLLYFERTFDTGSRRDAWLMMASFVAQVYSCIYYSVFLATALVPIAAVRLWRLPADARRRVIRATIPAAIVGARSSWRRTGTRTRSTATTLGERLDADILLYSATLSNYLATTAANVIHGGWSAPFGQSGALPVPRRAGDRAGGARPVLRSIAGARRSSRSA